MNSPNGMPAHNITNDLTEKLRACAGQVRLIGGDSRAMTLPREPGATRLSLDHLNSIVRLNAGDQTCTVECGVPRAELDAALAEHGLELPCIGGGTIGGLFASDPFGPTAAGGPSPRNLLLGVEALLADGTPFRSGARVVKNVAGFDVHKLFVGSKGRLFAVLQLHLRLQSRPRAEQWFANDKLEQDDALALLHALRAEHLPPTVLQFLRQRDGSHAVRGRVTGRSAHVQALVQRHQLESCAPLTCLHVDAHLDLGEEVVQGLARPSALGTTLRALGAGVPFTWLGGARFEAALPNAAATDAAIARLPQALATAAILIAPDHRRGISTPMDTGEQQLALGLKQALDPNGILV